MKSTQRNLRGGTLSVLVAACMLLCVLSPAIVNWNEEGFFAEGDDSESLYYVSIGDSMANGYGHTGYFPVDENRPGIDVGNYNGLLVEVTSTFPYLLKKYLHSDLGYDVEFVPLAASGMRSAEFRLLIDDTFKEEQAMSWAGLADDDYGDASWHYVNMVDSLFNNDRNEKPDGTKYINPSVSENGDRDYENPDEIFEGMSAFYRDEIAKADLITYNFHYDFGYTLTQSIIMSFIESGTMDIPSFDTYIDKEYRDFFNYVLNVLMGYVAPLIDGVGIPGEVIDFAKGIATGLAYCIISYCINFDKNMEIIFSLTEENEKGVDIVVIDSYNTFKNMIMTVNDERVPLGDLYGFALNIANTYTRVLSPFADKVYHTTVDAYPTLFSDEFKAGAPSSDAKSAFVDALYSTINQEVLDPKTGYPLHHDYYNSIYNVLDANGNLTKFLSHVFSTTELDWSFFIVDDFDEVLGDMGEAVGKLFPSENSGGLLLTGEVIINEDGSCVVTDGKDRVELSKGQISLLWMNFYVMEGDAIISHPSHGGHNEIFEDILFNSEMVSEEDSEVAQLIVDATIGFGIIAMAIAQYGDDIAMLDEYQTLMNDLGRFLAYVEKDPLSAFLTLSREVAMEGLEIFIEDSIKLVGTLMGMLDTVPIPNELIEDAKLSSSIVIAALYEIESVAYDFSIYDLEKDRLCLNFNPNNAYEEVYFGGVFQKLEQGNPTTSDILSSISSLDDFGKVISGLIGEDYGKILLEFLDDDHLSAIESADLIHIASASGNTQFLLNSIFPYVTGEKSVDDYVPQDYSNLSAILGDDVSAMVGTLRDEIASYMVDDTTGPNIINVALDLVTYAYFESLVSTMYLINAASVVNPDAAILLYGTYNEFRGLDLKIGEDIVPIGDILDKIYAAYDIIMYQIAEMSDQVGFVDVSEGTVSAVFGTECDITDFIKNGNPFPLVPLIIAIASAPDNGIFETGADKWLVLENTLYEITWVTCDDTIVENVPYDVLPEGPSVSVPEGFKFVGWDKEIVKAREDTTYTAVYEYVIEDTTVDTVVIGDKSDLDAVDVAQVSTDNWTLLIPTAVFDGLEGEVEISVKVVDNKDVPAKIAAYAEGKRIVSLNLSVGGETVSDFGENTVTVTFAYQPDVGEKMDNISVFWIDDANYRTVEYPAYYDADTGEVTFDTTHFSYWFVGERTVADDEDAGNDYLVSIIAFIVIIVGLCGFLLRLKR